MKRWSKTETSANLSEHYMYFFMACDRNHFAGPWSRTDLGKIGRDH